MRAIDLLSNPNQLATSQFRGQQFSVAISLVWALLTESPERRFDRAFGMVRSKDDRNQWSVLVDELPEELKTETR